MMLLACVISVLLFIYIIFIALVIKALRDSECELQEIRRWLDGRK